MTENIDSLTRIESLRAEIAALEISAVAELRNRKAGLLVELDKLDFEIARITGKTPKSASARVRTGRSIPLQELKELLERVPEKTLNIRKEKLDYANIKTLANANPHLLAIAAKGPWPTVTLLK